jgi:hypothetical protein
MGMLGQRPWRWSARCTETGHRVLVAVLALLVLAAHAGLEDGEEVTAVGIKDCLAVPKALLEHADLLPRGGSSFPMQVLYPSSLMQLSVLLPLAAMHVFDEML